MRPVNDRSADFRERVPTGSARRRLLIPPVLDQKARISTAQGCQLHAVILAKKRSCSSNRRMFTTSPCTKTSVSLFSMPVSEYSVQAPGLTVFIYTFYKAIIIAASRHPASRTISNFGANEWTPSPTKSDICQIKVETTDGTCGLTDVGLGNKARWSFFIAFTH